MIELSFFTWYKKRGSCFGHSFRVTLFHNSARCSRKRFNLFNFVLVSIKRNNSLFQAAAWKSELFLQML